MSEKQARCTYCKKFYKKKTQNSKYCCFKCFRQHMVNMEMRKRKKGFKEWMKKQDDIVKRKLIQGMPPTTGDLKGDEK